MGQMIQNECNRQFFLVSKEGSFGRPLSDAEVRRRLTTERTIYEQRQKEIIELQEQEIKCLREALRLKEKSIQGLLMIMGGLQ